MDAAKSLRIEAYMAHLNMYEQAEREWGAGDPQCERWWRRLQEMDARLTRHDKKLIEQMLAERDAKRAADAEEGRRFAQMVRERLKEDQEWREGRPSGPQERKVVGK